ACCADAGSVTGGGAACQGNILASAEVVPAMARAFELSRGRLADRLLEALRAAQREGGDRRGQESAALLVAKPGGGYGGNNDRYIDLRVDHHERPIEELASLLVWHRLYFDRPEEEELIPTDAVVEEEMRGMRGRLGKIEAGQDVWTAMQAYMGWENLEERWAGPGRLDPKVLDYLRQQAGS